MARPRVGYIGSLSVKLPRSHPPGRSEVAASVRRPEVILSVGHVVQMPPLIRKNRPRTATTDRLTGVNLALIPLPGVLVLVAVPVGHQLGEKKMARAKGSRAEISYATSPYKCEEPQRSEGEVVRALRVNLRVSSGTLHVRGSSCTLLAENHAALD